ncbi:rod shape-determining protein [Methanosarcina sp. KYL-1]|uniref:rod shape-determining protein n=1 Tax=Methanosarcina sp. KYL-1 TaxID=2602068 RepID=UPI00210189B1|nr:rod shape-determining protein [Methanosarcina sp. KYL-1]MCQ1534226.1 rod shape-determining protein [Methanosarcina sp. KYL-1]
MAKGLDVGTMNIISATKGEGSISFAQQRNAFLEMEANDLTQHMLDNAKVLYTQRGSNLNVLGEDAFKFSNVFNKSIRRPMKQGIISPDEKESIPMIKVIIERVIGAPEKKDEVLFVSVPANPVDNKLNVLYHSKTVEALAKKLGYNTFTIDEGLSVVYSELSDSNFTGVGVSIGAGMTNVTVAYMATPIVSFSIARGGDWIDEQVSVATGMAKERITAIKESDFSIGSEYELGSVQGALAVYYDALLTYVLQHLKRKLSETAPPDAEFQVAIAGGSTRAKGFVEMFEKRLKETNLPIRISSVKKARFVSPSGSDSRDPLYAIARGCLIAALTKEASLYPEAQVQTSAMTEAVGAEEED